MTAYPDSPLVDDELPPAEGPWAYLGFDDMTQTAQFVELVTLRIADSRVWRYTAYVTAMGRLAMRIDFPARVVPELVALLQVAAVVPAEQRSRPRCGVNVNERRLPCGTDQSSHYARTYARGTHTTAHSSHPR
ncbi:hypothetical protein, partial [Nonomuraea ceibae]|uniref:hypothetical protein n=1 Tax=Nonomuraea ceibae TaxID=1935170 RepID=UPI001C5F6514